MLINDKNKNYIHIIDDLGEVAGKIISIDRSQNTIVMDIYGILGTCSRPPNEWRKIRSCYVHTVKPDHKVKFYTQEEFTTLFFDILLLPEENS